jgi:hypothetical protein
MYFEFRKQCLVNVIYVYFLKRFYNLKIGWRFLSSGIWRRLFRWKSTDVLEEHFASSSMECEPSKEQANTQNHKAHLCPSWNLNN